MKARRENRFRSWMIIYAGMVAAVMVTVQEGGSLDTEAASVSPVATDTQYPVVELDSIARRSDI